MRITDTWDEIGERIEDGSYIIHYSIGDTKDINLYIDGEYKTISMQIAAFNEDNLFDTTGKAAITWISKDIVDYRVMNSEDEDVQNQGGWMLSGTRKYCADVLYKGIDTVVKNLIKPVRKTSYHAHTDSEHATKDYCWIPSHREIYGNNDYENNGPTYSTLFWNNILRTKHNSRGESDWWWLRSCVASAGFFVTVDSHGEDYDAFSSHEGGIILGFCT